MYRRSTLVMFKTIRIILQFATNVSVDLFPEWDRPRNSRKNSRPDLHWRELINGREFAIHTTSCRIDNVAYLPTAAKKCNSNLPQFLFSILADGRNRAQQFDTQPQKTCTRTLQAFKGHLCSIVVVFLVDDELHDAVFFQPLSMSFQLRVRVHQHNDVGCAHQHDPPSVWKQPSV